MSSTDFKKLSKEMSGSTGFFGSILLFSILALVIILIYWASKTELDNVTRGQGKIVSSIQNQIVQASEEGVIKARFVEEGQKVNSGDLLFKIDPIEAKTTFEQAMQRLASLSIQEIRLSAEVLGKEPIFDNTFSIGFVWAKACAVIIIIDIWAVKVNNFGKPFPQASKTSTEVESVFTNANTKVNTDKTITNINASG